MKNNETLIEQELLLLREVTLRLGSSLDSGGFIREVLHLLSELLGLKRWLRKSEQYVKWKLRA